MLTTLEKRIIASIQGDIPITSRPYAEIAQKLQISEDKLLETLEDLYRRGVIRRFGATLRHQKSGFEANAMVAWQIEEDQIEETGNKLASFRAVSHCYWRPPAGDWPYSLYTMIHAHDEQSCRDLAAEMSNQTGMGTYKLLFSRRELKKTSMQYFPLET